MTRRRVWTEDDVRRELPEVPAIVDGVECKASLRMHASNVGIVIAEARHRDGRPCRGLWTVLDAVRALNNPGKFQFDFGQEDDE